MNKSTILVFAFFVFAGIGMVGCSNTTTPVSPTPVTFTAGHTATYQEYSLDTANGAYGLGNPDATTFDTVHQSLKNTNYTFQNRSSVIFFENVHSRQVPGVSNTDSTFYYQDANANLYIYDYGLNSVNNNPFIVGQLGQQLHLGWVLLAKLGASIGSSWSAGDTTIYVDVKAAGLTHVPIHIVDTATYVGDTSVIAGGITAMEPLSSKHISHVVRVTSIYQAVQVLTLTLNADTYINLSQNTVLNIVHPSITQSPVPSFANRQTQGNYAKLIAHN